MTRKRLWKDADGNIVSKKPQIDETNEHETCVVNDAAPLLSPPLSFGTADNQDAMNVNSLDRSPPLLQDQSDSTELDTAILTQNGHLPEMTNFAVDDNLFEDAFNPDTGLALIINGDLHCLADLT